MPWRRLAYPLALLLGGAAPAVVCARGLLERPRLAVAADLAVLWMVLMIWLALGRLRRLEPRPPRRDDPAAGPAWFERVAATLLGVSDLLGNVVLPVCLLAGGLALVRSPLRAGPAFAGIAVALVAAVGLLRAGRAVLLFGRPSLPAPAPAAGEASGREEPGAEGPRTVAFAIGSAVAAGVAVGVGALALVVLAAVARASG